MKCCLSVNTWSNSTVEAIGRPWSVAGFHLKRRAAATAASSKPKPAPRSTFTAAVAPSSPTVSSSETVPEMPARRAASG